MYPNTDTREQRETGKTRRQEDGFFIFFLFYIICFFVSVGGTFSDHAFSYFILLFHVLPLKMTRIWKGELRSNRRTNTNEWKNKVTELKRSLKF